MNIDKVTAMVEADPPPILAQIRRLRPYQIPKEYLSWRSLSVMLAIAVTSRGRSGDLTHQSVFHRMRLWLIQDAPLYCISRELLDAFLQTDAIDRQGLLQGLQAPVPSLMLLLPAGAMRTPAGDDLKNLIIHFSDRRYPERSTGISKEFGIEARHLGHSNLINIQCGGTDEAGTVWFAGMGLEEDGTLSLERNIADDYDAGDPEFLDSMRSVTLQVILALQYQPDLFLEEAPAPARSAGFGRPAKPDKPAHRTPRWIGKDFKTQTSKASSGGGSHASPRSHWRRGHLRRVAIGEGRADRKVVWIQPVLVNPQSG